MSRDSVSAADPRPAPGVGEPAERWRAFVEGFVEGFFERHPDAAVAAGRHEHDGRLPDWSPGGLRERVDWLRDQLRRARRFEEDALPAEAAFERSYLIAEIEARLFWLVGTEWPWRSPSFYLDSLDPEVYVARPYASREERLRAYTEYASRIPGAASQIRANLRSPMPRAWARLGRESCAGLASFFEAEIEAAFAGAGDAALRSAFGRANRSAAEAIRALADSFGEDERDGDVAFALGAERFSEMLRLTEGVELELSELERAGERELQRNLEELGEACGRLGDADPTACVAAVRARKPRSGMVVEARRQVARLRRFVGEHDLVSIPAHPEVRVEESPPYMRWNSAYIHIPGPYDGDLSPTYYLAPPDPAWSEQERADYVPGRADLLFSSVHEVWPGHYLHFLHAHASASPLARNFIGYAFAEGWAHYAEEMVWDAGLERGDPEVHVGKVLNALVRTVRYLVAIGLHTGTLSVDEAERLFREKAFLGAAAARQQAARGTFDPGFLNYAMGKLAIRKLRENWMARGPDRGLRGFHDRLLSLGGPPLSLAREALLGPDAGPLL